jgi:hypothetical protein
LNEPKSRATSTVIAPQMESAIRFNINDGAILPSLLLARTEHVSG